MMGIYITGMKMPKEGCYHRICIYPDGAVPVEGEMYEAVPVPPHGRLIDADKFYEDVTESAIMTDDFKDAFALCLETQETVIPAEPPKEET